MHSQRHRFFKKKNGGGPPDPTPMKGVFTPLSYSPPLTACAARFKPAASNAPPPPPPPRKQPLWVQPLYDLGKHERIQREGVRTPRNMIIILIGPPQ